VVRKIESTLWTEKYRPRTMEDVVIDDSTRKMLQSFIDKKSVPHSLFVGRPGTGKTTIALILRDKLINVNTDCLFLNASDDRGINAMRDNVLTFMKVPCTASPHKLVILDECDNLTEDAWRILRNPMENEEINYRQMTRFIMTANYISKIPDFMQSRCTVLEFTYPPRQFAFNKAKEILEKENIEYDENTITRLVDNIYPDMRSIISTLQASAIDGKLDYKVTVSQTRELVEKVKAFLEAAKRGDQNALNAELTSIRTNIHNMDVDLVEVCKIVMNEMEMTPVVYIVFNRYLNKFGSAMDKSHHFCAMLYESVLQQARLGG